jgi:hypothetical protein
MSGWTYSPPTAEGGDEVLTPYLAEFRAALNERFVPLLDFSLLPYYAANPPFATTAADGESTLADVSHIAGWQAAVEYLCDFYVVSHVAGVERAPSAFAGAAAIPVYGNGATGLAALMSAAGLATTDWRRYTRPPSAGGSDLHGRCQAGDLRGPWLLEDLYRCLNCLVWTRRGLAFRGEPAWGDNYACPAKSAYGASFISLADAVNACLANWPQAGTAGSVYNPVGPASSASQFYAAGTGKWEAWTVRIRPYGVAPGDNSVAPGTFPLACAADWWGYTAAAGTFDAQGDAGIADGGMSLLLQEAAAARDYPVCSVQIPGPEVAACPVNFPVANGDQGWACASDGGRLVLRWDVAGGFART